MLTTQPQITDQGTTPLVKKDTKARLAKKQIVSEIKQNIEKATSAVFCFYHGSDAVEMTELRINARSNGVIFKIYRNNLVRIALIGLGILAKSQKEIISGPIVCLFSTKNPFSSFDVANQIKEHVAKNFKLAYSVFGGYEVTDSTSKDFLKYKSVKDLHRKLV